MTSMMVCLDFSWEFSEALIAKVARGNAMGSIHSHFFKDPGIGST